MISLHVPLVPGPEVMKMLNSAEHKIFPAH